MRRTSCAVVLMATVVVEAASAAPARSVRRKEERPRVEYVTGERVYLSRGRRDGLEPGSTVELIRGRVTCTIEFVADHFATCRVKGVATGRAFELPETAAPPEQPELRVIRDSPPTPELLQRAGSLLAAQQFEPVPYRAVPATRRSVVRGGIAYQFWQRRAQRRPWQVTRLSLDARRVPLGWAPLSLSASLTAERWLHREDTTRFRGPQPARFYLWELAARYDGESLTAQVGRLAPAGVPGLVALDGAMFRARTRSFDSGWLEAGLYGGGIPDYIDYQTATESWTAGIFYGLGVESRARWRAAHLGGLGMTVLRAEPARLAWQPRLQGQVAGLVDLDAEARFDLGEVEELAADGMTLEMARASLNLYLASSFDLWVQARHVTTEGAQADPFWLLGNGSSHGESGIRWRLFDRVRLGFGGHAVRSLETLRVRVLAGPTVDVSTAGRGIVSLGYQEEVGWVAGRNVYLQAVDLLPTRWDLLVRASYSTSVLDPDRPEHPLREVGLFGHLRFRATDRFAAGIRVLTRAALNDVLGPGLAPQRFGFGGRLTIEGEL